MASPKHLNTERKNALQASPLGTYEFRSYIRYLSSPGRVFWMNFLAGTAQGLGFVVGTVIVLTLTAVIVGQYLTQIPWIGELFRWLDVWMQQNLDTYQNGSN